MGAYGSAPDYHIEKYLRDSKILQLTLGGPQRNRLDVALGYYPFEWTKQSISTQKLRKILVAT